MNYPISCLTDGLKSALLQRPQQEMKLAYHETATLVLSRWRAAALPTCGLVAMFFILRCRQCLQIGCSWSPHGCTWANAGERNVNTQFSLQRLDELDL